MVYLAFLAVHIEPPKLKRTFAWWQAAFRRTVCRASSFPSRNPEMISVLAQERLLGAALGSIFMGVIVFEQRKGIYALISENHPQTKARYEEGCRGLVKGAERFDASMGFKFSTYAHWWIKQSVCNSLSEQSRAIRLPLMQPVNAKKPALDYAHVWNKAVDRTMGPVIVALSSRGW